MIATKRMLTVQPTSDSIYTYFIRTKSRAHGLVQHKYERIYMRFVSQERSIAATVERQTRMRRTQPMQSTARSLNLKSMKLKLCTVCREVRSLLAHECWW